MCTTEKLKLFLDDNVKEVREILAKNGYIIDIVELAKLDITSPIIKKSKDME